MLVVCWSVSCGRTQERGNCSKALAGRFMDLERYRVCRAFASEPNKSHRDRCACGISAGRGLWHCRTFLNVRYLGCLGLLEHMPAMFETYCCTALSFHGARAWPRCAHRRVPKYSRLRTSSRCQGSTVSANAPRLQPVARKRREQVYWFLSLGDVQCIRRQQTSVQTPAIAGPASLQT